MENEPQQKWEGKVCAKLTGPKAEQVWPLLEDFFNLHKWLPTIDTCRRLDGVSGQPGCIRYCAATSISPGDGGNEKIQWATERLVSIDQTERCISYEIVENNMGFKSYVATMKVLPEENEEQEKQGCEIEWSFVADPIEGWRLEDMVSFFYATLEGMAKRMEETLQSSK